MLYTYECLPTCVQFAVQHGLLFFCSASAYISTAVFFLGNADISYTWVTPGVDPIHAVAGDLLLRNRVFTAWRTRCSYPCSMQTTCLCACVWSRLYWRGTRYALDVLSLNIRWNNLRIWFHL